MQRRYTVQHTPRKQRKGRDETNEDAFKTMERFSDWLTDSHDKNPLSHQKGGKMKSHPQLLPFWAAIFIGLSVTVVSLFQNQALSVSAQPAPGAFGSVALESRQLAPPPTSTPAAEPANGRSVNAPSSGTYVIATATATIVPGVTDTGNHCDDCDTLVPLPFSFKLYGQTFTTVNVNSNGRLDFVTVNEPGGFQSQCLPPVPNQGPYAYTIFPLWHDMRTSTDQSGCSDFASSCGIFSSVFGAAPNRTFNIEWRAVRFANMTNSVNFEVRLYENSPNQRFDIIYGTINGVIGSDTAGVQGPTGSFTQDFCNMSPPPNGSLRIYTLKWLSWLPLIRR